MNRILFIAMHRPDRSPSQRFRFEQYLGYLNQRGFEYDFSYLITENDDKIFYQPGNYLSKFKIFVRSVLTRLKDIIAANKYDIIFIQREAFMTGTTFFEKIFSKTRAKVIFDFDDSIWIQNISEANKLVGWLKNADKTKDIIKIADLIFAGNQYLADYALQYNTNVKIVPTTIDTDEYRRMPKYKNLGKICIGWSGSFSTIEHFEYALPALLEIKDKYQDKVKFKVIGDGNYKNTELNIQGLPWKKSSEIEDLSEFDIGIMPLPNSEWAKGKCGLKGLQYMALEIATVMSPVGVNSQIIQDGENGYLAEDHIEWINKLSLLVENELQRISMGLQGRKTVEEAYSVESEKDTYVGYFKSLL